MADGRGHGHRDGIVGGEYGFMISDSFIQPKNRKRSSGVCLMNAEGGGWPRSLSHFYTSCRRHLHKSSERLTRVFGFGNWELETVSLLVSRVSMTSPVSEIQLQTSLVSESSTAPR